MIDSVKRPKEKERQIAEERVDILLHNALDLVQMDPGLAVKQVEMAMRITMKYNLRRQSLLKRYFLCRYCKRALIPSVTNIIRVKKGKLQITCQFCGRTKHIIIK